MAGMSLTVGLQITLSGHSSKGCSKAKLIKKLWKQKRSLKWIIKRRLLKEEGTGGTDDSKLSTALELARGVPKALGNCSRNWVQQEACKVLYGV